MEIKLDFEELITLLQTRSFFAKIIIDKKIVKIAFKVPVVTTFINID